VAFFGEKDGQQLALIRRMVADLNFPVEIVGVPTVREPDGLALSSRNRYLSEQDRVEALALSRALFAGRDAAPDGPDAVRKAAGAVLERSALAPDYLGLIDPSDFTAIDREDYRGEAVLAVAARVGTTRLIDNVRLGF
jgi:pantoate--beta-alanine ligase